MTEKAATPGQSPQPGRIRRAFDWAQTDAPLYAIIVIAFAGSLGHEIQVAVDHGQHGGEAVAIAAAIDLFCFVTAKERQRDKKIGRQHRGIASMPTIALLIGVALTLAMNLATATPGVWGHVVAGAPGGLLLILIALLERREGFRPPAPVPADAPGTGPVEPPRQFVAEPVPAPGTGTFGYRMSAPAPGSGDTAAEVTGTGTGDAAPAPVAETAHSPAPPAAEARPAPPAASARPQRPTVTFRSEEELEAEALQILAGHKAATGERMNTKALAKALAKNYNRTLAIRAAIKDREEGAV